MGNPATFDFYADLAGAAFGSLVWVNIFRAIAGVHFSHWRQIATAYLVAFLALVHVPWVAVNSTVQYGPPVRFSHMYAFALGSALGALVELILLHRRTRKRIG
jgi:hypothetical protein